MPNPNIMGFLEKMKVIVEAPDKAILILTTFPSPRESDKGPPIRAPTPYMRKLMVAMMPKVWRDAFRSLETFPSKGGSTRNNEWFNEWAAPKSNRTRLPFFMVFYTTCMF